MAGLDAAGRPAPELVDAQRFLSFFFFSFLSFLESSGLVAVSCQVVVSAGH